MLFIFAKKNKVRYNIFIIGCLAMLFFTACVPQRKYQDLMDKYYAIEGERTKAIDESKSAIDDYEFCKKEYQILLTQLKAKQNDSSSLALTINGLRNELANLKSEHEIEIERNKDKLNDANQQNQLSTAQLIQKEVELQRKELEISKKEAELALKQMAMDKVSMQNADLDKGLKDREKKIADLEALLNEQKKKSEELKAKIVEAFTKFSSADIKVENKNGKIYVSLSEKLLFKSGSTTVDPIGVEALGKLAEVIKANPSMNVLVQGHTDNVPLSGTGSIKDNWDLSVLRATSIVRILTWKYSVSPIQVIASGRGEHFPIDTNTTTEGKAKNRRTEIILSPNLDNLMDILHDNK